MKNKPTKLIREEQLLAYAQAVTKLKADCSYWDRYTDMAVSTFLSYAKPEALTKLAAESAALAQAVPYLVRTEAENDLCQHSVISAQACQIGHFYAQRLTACALAAAEAVSPNYDYLDD